MRVFPETEALRQRSPLDEDAGARRRAGDGAESSRMGEFQTAEGAKETVPAERSAPRLANWECSVGASSEPKM